MIDNPYVCERLAATRAGIPDPLVEVDCWLSQLADLLDSDVDSSEQSYDMLAVWAKLRRSRPELVNQLNGDETLARSVALISARGVALASLALDLPDAEAWLRQADSLSAAYEDIGRSDDRSELAERLLCDLDDAQLVFYAARRLGVEDCELEASLDCCEEWLLKHADSFLAASVYVQAAAMTFRPDLADFDYDLTLTALKFVDLLRAAEAAEAELTLRHMEPLEPTVAQALADKYRKQRAPYALAAALTMLRQRMRARPLARAGDETVLEPLLWWEWTSSEQDRTARLTIPPRPLQDEVVRLLFLRADSTPAIELEGHEVSLHGVQATIDAKGQATFQLAELLEVSEPAFVLRVGPQGDQWPLTSSSTLA